MPKNLSFACFSKLVVNKIEQSNRLFTTRVPHLFLPVRALIKDITRMWPVGHIGEGRQDLVCRRIGVTGKTLNHEKCSANPNQC